MKHKRKIVGALLIAGMVATSSIQGFAKLDGLNLLSNGINQFENKTDKKDEVWQDKYMATDGIITAVEAGKDASIFVEGKAASGKLGGYDIIKLIIAPSTDIIDYETGKKLTVSALKTDVAVTAYYEGRVTRSVPPIGVAKKIVVKQAKDEYAAGIYGEIKKITDVKTFLLAYVQGEAIGDAANNKIMLAIGEETEIVDYLTGEELTKDDIKEGSMIYGYYEGAVTKSMPPMAPAEKIVVLSNDSNKKIEWATEGKIEDLKVFENDGKKEVVILLSGNKLGDYGYDEINLIVSEKTSIISAKDGRDLTIDCLKSGVEVNAYYGGNVTTSIPPKGNAIKIVVNE